MIINTNNESLEQKIKLCWGIRECNFPKQIGFDFPKETTPISLTGNSCSLDCAHCGGHYLKHMKCMKELDDSSCSSVLISGGCNPFGTVDFIPYISQILKLRDKNIRVNIHTGLIDLDNIDKVKAVADTVSFDFLVDDETITTVYGTNKTGQDYINTYSALYKKVDVVPHICIGLLGGQIKGEYSAITELKKIGASRVVFIIFIPTANTRFAKCSPPELDKILDILCFARQEFPNTPIHLGCMRPKGRYREQIDLGAISCGINKIVNPTKKAVEYANSLELEIVYGKECCTL